MRFNKFRILKKTNRIAHLMDFKSDIQRLRPEIRNKIMLYALSCPHNIKKQKIPKWSKYRIGIDGPHGIRTDSKNGYTDITEWETGTILKTTHDQSCHNHYSAFNYRQHPNICGFKIIVFAPSVVNNLHFMRRPHNQGNTSRFAVPCKHVKTLARVNQINGRSKLKTRLDYIKAFMRV